MSSRGAGGGRRIPTPMPPLLPPGEGGWPYRSTPRLVGSDASYKLSTNEMNALNAVKATVPKMDKNGYFFYVASTAKKKKISLMQPKPPRVAFVDECVKRKLVPGAAERVYKQACGALYQCRGEGSTAPTASEYGRGDSMTNRGPSPAPRARLYTQLESYQPRYHTIRDREVREYVKYSEIKESECRRRKKEKVPAHPQQVFSQS